MASLSESVDIVWLRDDYRLDDQPAIHAAARARALAAFAKMRGR
jgi:deoxyribodipyrimidine photolyase